MLLEGRRCNGAGTGEAERGEEGRARQDGAENDN